MAIVSNFHYVFTRIRSDTIIEMADRKPEKAVRNLDAFPNSVRHKTQSEEERHGTQ